MILAQGWTKAADGRPVVEAVALSRCTNGMAGWEIHVGTYDANAGQTIQQATWRFACASFSVADLILHTTMNIMTGWADSQAEMTSIRSLVETLAAGAKAMEANIESAFRAGAPV